MTPKYRGTGTSKKWTAKQFLLFALYALSEALELGKLETRIFCTVYPLRHVTYFVVQIF